MIKLIQLKATKPYNLRLQYSDGTEGEVDFSDLVKSKIGRSLQDFGVFSKVRTDGSGIIRNDDVDADALNQYLKIRNIDFMTYKSLYGTNN